MKILACYDGTVHAKKALRYGIEKIRSQGGELAVLLVFDRSQFIDYEAGPQAEGRARAEWEQQLHDAKEIVSEVGGNLKIEILSGEGSANETIARVAIEHQPDLVLLPKRLREIASVLSCPVQVVPGTLLVPVDASADAALGIESIVQEANATGSGVLLLGIVPIHLYSKEEKKELERVKDSTSRSLKRLAAALKERKIEVREALRSGYPDEEILKAAAEHTVSLILLPSGSTTPSELSKAAAMLLDEPARLKWPVFLVPHSSV